MAQQKTDSKVIAAPLSAADKYAADRRVIAEKHAATMEAKVKVLTALTDMRRSDELDTFTINVNGVPRPISKCTPETIVAYADRCESEARRAREYLATRKKRR